MPKALLIATLAALTFLALPLHAQDHPLISAYPDSQQTERKLAEFDAYARIVGMKDDASLTETLEGKVTRLRYRNPKGRSTLEILANYRQALEAAGLKVDYDCVGSKACASTGVGHRQIPGWGAINGMNLGAVSDVRYFTGKMSHEGGIAYVAVGVNPSVHFVHVVEIQAMQQGLVKVDATALSQALDRDGRVVVEGIFFDTDSARLQPASHAALEEVARLLRERPQIRLYVVGHTDSQGSFAHNQRLSADRAASVVEALGSRFGVARERLSAHGVGPLSPAAGNASESGRAKNRRVEIVLQ
jgi:outer membrane protein OmpA-like peptidoglycan-associated protein